MYIVVNIPFLHSCMRIIGCINKCVIRILWIIERKNRFIAKGIQDVSSKINHNSITNWKRLVLSGSFFGIVWSSIAFFSFSFLDLIELFLYYMIPVEPEPLTLTQSEIPNDSNRFKTLSIRNVNILLQWFSI